MRINDITTEAEYGTKNAKEIDRYFKSNGYTKIGTGADATVYSKDDRNVVKILMPEDPSTQSEKVFEKFYEFCMTHNDYINLPKFDMVSKFKVFDDEYTLIYMEKLYPLQNGSFQEAMVWLLSDLATKNINSKSVFKNIKNPNLWKYFPGDLPYDEILKNLHRLNKRQLTEYNILFVLMTMLYKTGNINKIGWDLHTENVMQRKDGTLVIIDPWFAMNED